MGHPSRTPSRPPGSHLPGPVLPGLLLALAALLAAACSPIGMAVGAGASAGIMVAQERDLSAAANDATIELEINRLWLAESISLFSRVGLQVVEGRVLLTGVVETPEDRLTAVRLAWQASGVREVINEIEVAATPGAEGYGRDLLIATRLRTRLLFDGDVSAINYSIEVVKGVVYLMGIARSQAELDRVVTHARDIAYVRRIVSHVVLADDPSRTVGGG
ncbi:MAG: BON domain-containing protein [Alphaproteobacteria bacterium]